MSKVMRPGQDCELDWILHRHHALRVEQSADNIRCDQNAVLLLAGLFPSWQLEYAAQLI